VKKAWPGGEGNLPRASSSRRNDGGVQHPALDPHRGRLPDVRVDHDRPVVDGARVALAAAAA
jgi:hypothetical protein